MNLQILHLEKRAANPLLCWGHVAPTNYYLYREYKEQPRSHPGSPVLAFPFIPLKTLFKRAL